MAKKRIKMATLLFIFLFIAGTSLAVLTTETSVADPEQVFIIGVSVGPESVNPFTSTSFYDYLPMALLYDALIYGDKDTWVGSGEFKPNLASSWSLSSDNLTVTFNLDTDAKWHDGEDFDAYDAKFSYDALFYCSDEGYPMEFDPVTLSYIDTWNIVDADTFSITLTDTFAPVFDLISAVWIIPEHHYNTSTAFNGDPLTDINAHPSFVFEETPIGSGQYKFEDYDTTTEVLTLTKNDDYHRGTVEVDKIKFIEYESSPTKVAALEAGEVDFIDTVPGANVPSLQENPDITVDIVRPGGTYRMYMLNAYKAPFNVTEVRQGFQMNVNRTFIVEYVMGGYATINNADISPSSWAHPTDVDDMWPYNETAALELWDSVGFVDGGALDQTPPGDGFVYEMDIRYNYGNTEREQICNYLAYRFASLPEDYRIRINILPVDWGDIYETCFGINHPEYTIKNDWDPKNDWDAYMIGLAATSPDPDDFTTVAGGDITVWPPQPNDDGIPVLYDDYRKNWSPWNYNMACWYNATVDDLTVQARTTLDIATRQSLYYQQQRMVAEEVPFGFLYYEDDMYAYNKDWTGLDLGPNPFTIDMGIDLSGPGAEEEDNTLLYVGVGVIAAVVVAAAVIFMRKRGEE